MMPSPFPGMNPYLEHPHVWHDFHEQFCVFCRMALLPSLLPKYYCRLDEHVYIHELPPTPARLIGRGDVMITKVQPESESREATAVLSRPSVRGRILPRFDYEREVALEIRERESEQLITTIELLSPSNKRQGEDRQQFLAKRHELLSSDTHYVEIDLLRGGPRLPIEGLPPCDYYALTSRVESRPDVEIWSSTLRQRLPEINIPLRTPDPDVVLDLQAVLYAAFDAGRYDAIVYKHLPEPPLAPEDQAWADGLIKASQIN